MKIVIGGNFPEGSCPGHSYCGWELSRGSYLGEIVLEPVNSSPLPTPKSAKGISEIASLRY